jgi:hypothetical protein
VTRKRRGAGSAKAFSPDWSLIQRYATTYGWKTDNLAAVLSDFGPLPEVEQEQLIKCLVLAFGGYQFRSKTTERISPSEQRNQLEVIEQTARKLLQELGSAHVNMWLVTAGIVTAGRDETTVNAELRKASDSLADAVRALTDLRARAKIAALAASKRTAPGRGGSRHRPGAKGQLIKDAIAIYSHMRRQYPHCRWRNLFVRSANCTALVCGTVTFAKCGGLGNQNKNNFDLPIYRRRDLSHPLAGDYTCSQTRTMVKHDPR